VPTLPQDSDTDSSSDDDTVETKSKFNIKKKAGKQTKSVPEPILQVDDLEVDEDETRELELAVEGEEIDGEVEIFSLPTVEEREEERKGAGPSVQVLQRRIQGCSAVLSNFQRLGQKGR
jgi:hypothetical protein